jgi:hypothetical protein
MDYAKVLKTGGKSAGRWLVYGKRLRSLAKMRSQKISPDIIRAYNYMLYL